MKAWLVKLTLATLLLPAAVTAQERPNDWEGDSVDRRQPVAKRYRSNLGRTHDRGALVRVNLGTTYNDSGASGLLPNSSMALDGALAIGWLPVEQVAMHVGASGWLVVDRQFLSPQIGATYFFKEGHIYGGLQVGPAFIWDRRAAEQSLTEGERPAGVAFAGELAVGKLWWVGRRWSMGAALTGGLHGGDLDGDGTVWRGWRAGLRLELLFN
jgi:hypothetical protein